MTRVFRWLVIVLALQLPACATSQYTPESEPVTAPPPDPVSQAATPIPPPEAVVDKSSYRVSLSAVGDMMLGTDFPENHLPDDDGVSFLSAVSPIISAADIAIGNLEGVLVDGGEPAKKCSNPSACYLFRSPTRYARLFKDAGFDALSLANNHARDFGEEGRTSSMKALSAVGIGHAGRDGTFDIIESNGLTIAFLAYAVTKNSNMMLDYEFAFETIRHHANECDIVIVSFHGGAEGSDVTHVPFKEEEYYGEPRGDVVWFARGAVDAGADLVVGHGPHVVRGLERYNERLIAYSLGNFATYYGISVAGIKGIAPILNATLDGNGVFIEGHITSTIQLRPQGPSVDKRDRALNLMRDLSLQDFGNPGLEFRPDGKLLPIDRGEVSPHSLAVEKALN